ncbi:HNH endonuclease signature motif containing protein [Rhodococcus opacus]|uniref:HNH endonuclease n=1 Tax=Rhodococcus opacus (strain B4) TaxID=632772 RepID=C1B104_RHOOB|nr:hypothetical protein ROP_21070 [Rhodococcus opacus B4]
MGDTGDVAATIRADRKARRLPQSEWDRGIASQIGLARRESPNRGGRHLGFARAMVHEMPHTLAMLQTGRLNEWRATLLVRETACLSAEDRGTIDRRLCSDPSTLDGVGDAGLIATGDSGGRTRNQLMVDLLFERGTGASVAGGVPVAVDLVLSDETLLAGGHEAAELPGYGPVPAGIARQLLADAVSTDTDVLLQRVYSCPRSGALTAMESQARTFPKGLAKLIDLRDRTCRTPWCDAPIRHHDHIRSHDDSGPTSAHNGAGLCAACNYAKEAPGWVARPVTRPGGRHLIDLGTPTGHHYNSTAPPLPAAARQSAVEAVPIAPPRAS